MVAKRRVETMEENRAKLIAAARNAFAEKGYSAASMDELTAEAGLTRGALYHNFGDKRGLLAAVVHQIDAEMAARAQEIGAQAGDDWDGLLAEGAAYIEMALNPEVQRIVLLDGPAVLGMSAIEQNGIIKIFSVAAVVFLPPTLVASIYGMNFKFMPELDWVYGYPMALGIMVLSAFLPWLYFKQKGWL
jgi:AcrR family transcriptional regulator